MRITKDTPGYLGKTGSRTNTASIAELCQPLKRPVVELQDPNEERRGLHPAFIADVATDVKS